jgi:hypothetical protein
VLFCVGTRSEGTWWSAAKEEKLPVPGYSGFAQNQLHYLACNRAKGEKSAARIPPPRITVQPDVI